VQRATGAPLDLSAGGEAPPSVLERWKLPLTAVLLIAAVVGTAWWLTRRPVEQPIAIPASGGEPARQVKVHVTGAVARPGLYTLAGTARVSDAIDEAGGAIADADLSRVNLALRLRDGQQVVVPAQSAFQPPAAAGSAATAVPATGAPATARATSPARAAKPATARPDAKLNLNRATAAELEALPGIGAATAKRIFETADDLLKARLVPARTWEQIKDLVEAP
jgi:competence protein ComEA